MGYLLNGCEVGKLTAKKPSYPGLDNSVFIRQPGCLIETRGFPSLPHDRFGFIISVLIIYQPSNSKQLLQKNQ